MDPFNLQRFLDAQAPIYQTALSELRAGEKRTHWMWFIFPQLRELGRSSTALFYGITGLDEAQAYLSHPVLGARLVECCEAMLSLSGKSAHEILGSPDDLKLRSCMTLFASVKATQPIFSQVLDHYYQGLMDANTISIVRKAE